MNSMFSCRHDSLACPRRHYTEAFICLLILLIVQVGLSFLTGSVSVIGDTIHLGSDTVGIFATLLILIVTLTRVVAQGAMRALITSNALLLIGGGIFLGIECYSRLSDPIPTNAQYVFFAGAIGWCGNYIAKELLVQVRIFPSEQYERNHTLNVLHLTSDAWMSLAVMLSAIFGAFFGGRIDAMAGLVIAVYITNEGLGHAYTEWTGKHYPLHIHIGDDHHHH